MSTRILSALASSLLASAAVAQTPINGPLSDATTGPLLAGVVYHVTSGVSVSPGATLTVQAGAIVKFPANSTFEVSGTLLCQGTAVSPVIFTAIADDSAGGDTNGNGPSSGAPGAWIYVRLYAAASASVLDHTELRYAGAFGWAGLNLSTSNPTLRDCVVRDCLGNGMDGFAVSSPIVERCHFQDNGGAAVVGFWLQHIAGFSQCTASGNAGGNYQLMAGQSVDGDVVVEPDDLIGGVAYLAGTVGMNAGNSLTLKAGVILKMGLNTAWEVSGKLVTQGTSLAPVVITDIADDSAGGDTNADGPSSGSAGHWVYLRIYNSASASVLDHLEVRYAGAFGWAGIMLNGSSPTLRDCVVRNCGTAGMDGLGVSTPIVERCHFQDNGDAAVTGVLLEQLAGFSQCTASGNAGGNYQRVANGSVSGNVLVQTDDLIGGVVVVASGVTVPAGTSLTLGPGVIVKNSSIALWSVSGGLTVQGTAAQPVVVTTLADDVYGGDTNQNGPSSGTPGAWIGMWLQGTQAATPIEHLLVRYAGGNGYSAVIDYPQAGYALSDSRIEYSQSSGFELRDHPGDARGLAAWKCAGTGVALLGGSFKLRQSTVVACGTGISRAAGFTGTVVDSIAWSNTSANTSGFTAGEWRFSNGNAGLVGIDGNIAVIPQFVDELNGDLELQAASACVNSGDPLSPLDPDGSRADMGAYPLNSCTPIVYCVGKTNSCGSVPSISWSGAMHAASGSGFVVKVTQAPGARSGLCFYGSSGAASLPFLGGTLCVQPPLNRSSTVSDTTGTPGQCNGVMQLDFAAFASGSLGGNPASWLSVPGQYVWCQFWGRDQPAGATMLSDALSFRVCP